MDRDAVCAEIQALAMRLQKIDQRHCQATAAILFSICGALTLNLEVHLTMHVWEWMDSTKRLVDAANAARN